MTNKLRLDLNTSYADKSIGWDSCLLNIIILARLNNSCMSSSTTEIGKFPGIWFKNNARGDTSITSNRKLVSYAGFVICESLICEKEVAKMYYCKDQIDILIYILLMKHLLIYVSLF